jgi:hypothetical protein
MRLGLEARLPRLVLYGIGLICLCVVMYSLGSTTTLWTMQFALDQADNPVLEGFSLPATLLDVTPEMPITSARETLPATTSDINEHSLLRPPNRTT